VKPKSKSPDEFVELFVVGRGVEAHEAEALVIALRNAGVFERVEAVLETEPSVLQVTATVCAVVAGIANLPKAIRNLKKACGMAAKWGKRLYLQVHGRLLPLGERTWNDIVAEIRAIHRAVVDRPDRLQDWHTRCRREDKRNARKLEAFCTYL
jgi:hypothetical protein